MNLKEGTRRLALLLGVAGAIAGGFASYAVWGEAKYAEMNHREYPLLATSDVVKQEREKCLADQQAGQWRSVAEVNRGGIKQIDWTQDCEAVIITTDEGKLISQTPAPPAWKYLLVALFPVLGFFIPWGAVRAIGWVGAGFIASGM
jgi:hypothetical protein